MVNYIFFSLLFCSFFYNSISINGSGSRLNVILDKQFWENDSAGGYTRYNRLREILDSSDDDPHAINSKGWNALTFAADHCDIEAIKILLNDYNFDVNHAENDGWTALHFCGYHGDEDCVRLLVEEYEANASLLNNNKFGVSTLLRNRGLVELSEMVTRVGFARAVERMSSSNPSITNLIMNTLHDSSSNPDHDVNPLYKGDWSNIQNESGWAPLHFCANLNDVLCIRSLLNKYNANINVLENDLWSPLHFAAFNGHIESVHEILSHHGALVKVEANNGIFSRVEMLKNANDLTPLALTLNRMHHPDVDNEKRMKLQVVIDLIRKYDEPLVFNNRKKRLAGNNGEDVVPGFFEPVMTFIFGSKAENQHHPVIQ
jgi:ankyrin repeat protein